MFWITAAFAMDPEIERLLRSADDVTRGASSVATLTMQVKTATYERTIRMQSWTLGTERTLVRILEPAKDAGIASLKVSENLWNYLPKVDRTLKVPSGMMSGSWMGSHVSNDDLVRESRFSEDYDATVRARPQGGSGQWTLALVPHPDAPVVWGRVELDLRPDELPLAVRYYDEAGALVRTMTFGEFAQVDGRTIPRTMTLRPADAPGEFTSVRYDAVDFDVQIPESTFTLQGLR